MIDTIEERDLFERVFLKYRYLMLYVANKILQNHHDAEDAVHEAFIAVIKNLEKFSDVESPKTSSLIVLIVERKAIDILRKKQRENLLEINEDILSIEMPVSEDHGLADAIARLPAHYREVLLMRYDNGLTTREIAKLLDITESGVRKMLGRAKRELRSELQKDGVAT
jgi:RNA polymerase sigma-70 factor (ECF subfamily)